MCEVCMESCAGDWGECRIPRASSTGRDEGSLGSERKAEAVHVNLGKCWGEGAWEQEWTMRTIKAEGDRELTGVLLSTLTLGVEGVTGEP